MIRNYFKTALRTLTKNRSYAAINIIGLSVSLAAAIPLLLWVWDELSFDRMHSKGDHIYRVATTFKSNDGQVWPVAPAPLAVFGPAKVPVIEQACRIKGGKGAISVTYQEKRFNEIPTYVDPAFFSIFDFPLLEGDQNNPFPDNHSIVISKVLARKYFGKAHAIGKMITGPENENYKVTGIIDDIPGNSSITASLLLPFAILNENHNGPGLNTEWGNFDYPTYFLLQANADPAAIGKQLADIQRENTGFYESLVYLMQPLHKIHLFGPKGEDRGMQQVKIFALIAIVILLIACINYVNLVTARSARRSREVSVRKIVGANKGHLFGQFISESLVVFIIALILAVGLVFLTIPFYNELAGKEMIFSLLDDRVWTLFGGILLIVLLAAGLYPALILSAFKPARSLKGILPGFGINNNFRKTLIVIQFICSVALIISTLVISGQLNYIREKKPGYNRENVFVFPQWNFADKYHTIRDKLRNQPGILGVTAASSKVYNIGSQTKDIEWEGKPASMSDFMINQISTDRNFLEVLDIELRSGKGFSGTSADSSYVILNETAVKQMNLKDPIGKIIDFHNTTRTIAGVARDFHFKNMKTAIEPCIIFMDPKKWGGMYVRTTSKDASEAIAAVERLWKQYNSDYYFDYEFLDESFDNLYKVDIRAGKLFRIFACIAILLSCLGLFGLITYTVETKVKEIGIRKILGADVANIVLLISKDFLLLVGLSFIVAFPFAWWMLNNWLNDYAYHTDIEWWVFVITGLIVLGITGITVGGKSLRAATANPVNNLRNE